MLRMPPCLDNRLTDGGKVVSPTHRPRSTPQILLFILLVLITVKELSKLQGLVRLEGLAKLQKFIHLIGSRTRDFPACSIVPQPLHHSVAHVIM
jgi:hypothetical protein